MRRPTKNDFVFLVAVLAVIVALGLWGPSIQAVAAGLAVFLVGMVVSRRST